MQAKPAESGLIQRQEEEEEEMQAKPAESGLIQRQEEEEEEMQAKPAEGGLIQRQEEEEEEELQAKAGSGGTCSACSNGPGDSAASSVKSGGRPLSESDRSYFEPRFGRDFSDVRVHTHSSAEKAAGSINAKAFTLGNNIAFGSGQFSPNSASGRHLLAHELAHVVQQKGGGQKTVRRTVSKHSKCKPSVNSAPSKPLDRLKKIDAKARVFAQVMGLGMALTSVDPVLFSKDVKKFTKRFGKAPAKGKRFRNRFNNKTFPTQDKAILSEMNSTSDLFIGVANRLSRPIVYRCPGTKTINLENCRDKCEANDVAWVCAGTSMSQMAVCPGFWGMSDDQLAGALIHEVMHARFNRKGHPENVKKRHRNPECFTSLTADTMGFTPFDVRCPKIP
ncbi:MAG: DUF4157 domain-containing protein [Candidatus Nitronauta litoralis]|uniref:DUF4157 domain-containing protein n=1 Tax=Candidatus Nitronauta litoralis TaxID=2705533 RepID=A0A7T0BZH8_9BACT|nr:MAG: DUF4157 domain-containing protein [Candidatus Nitronauta litoralis]